MILTIIPLGQNLSSDLFVDNDTNSVLCHIENSASLAVVVFERHALLEGTISLDVNDVTLLVNLQKSGQGLNTMFLEFLGEQVTGSTAITFRVHHFLILKIEKNTLSETSPATC